MRRLPISVSTRPGATTLTRTPWPRSSLARVKARASRAALPMLYGAPLAPWLSVATLEIMTMSPRGRVRMLGSTSWHRWWAPRAWTRTTRSSSAGSVSTTEVPLLAMPELLIMMSTWPKSASPAGPRPLAGLRGRRRGCFQPPGPEGHEGLGGAVTPAHQRADQVPCPRTPSHERPQDAHVGVDLSRLAHVLHRHEQG